MPNQYLERYAARLRVEVADHNSLKCLTTAVESASRQAYLGRLSTGWHTGRSGWLGLGMWIRPTVLGFAQRLKLGPASTQWERNNGSVPKEA